MDPTPVARVLAAGRVAIGLALFAAPSLATRGWVGEDDAETDGAKMLARATGARDVALGLGALVALSSGRGARRWVDAGTLADTADFTATLMSGRPARDTAPVLAIAGGAAALGAWLSRQLD